MKKIITMITGLLIQSTFCIEQYCSFDLQSLPPQAFRSGEVCKMIQERCGDFTGGLGKVRFLAECLDEVYRRPDLNQSLVTKTENYIIRYLQMVDASRSSSKMWGQPYTSDDIVYVLQENEKFKADLLKLEQRYKPNDPNFIVKLLKDLNYADSLIECISSSDYERGKLMSQFSSNKKIFRNSLSGFNDSISELIEGEFINEYFAQLIINNELLRESIIYATTNFLEGSHDKSWVNSVIETYESSKFDKLVYGSSISDKLAQRVHFTKFLAEKLSDIQVYRKHLLLDAHSLPNGEILKSELRREKLLHVVIKNELIRQKSIQKTIHDKINEMDQQIESRRKALLATEAPRSIIKS